MPASVAPAWSRDLWRLVDTDHTTVEDNIRADSHGSVNVCHNRFTSSRPRWTPRQSARFDVLSSSKSDAP
jgi:hypothetical protein